MQKDQEYKVRSADPGRADEMLFIKSKKEKDAMKMMDNEFR